MTELARIEVADPAAVFAARQLGRGIAAQLALEGQDQVRVATALSEVSRSAVTIGQRAVVAFETDATELIISVSLDKPGSGGRHRGNPADGPRRGERACHPDGQAAPGRRATQ